MYYEPDLEHRLESFPSMINFSYLSTLFLQMTEEEKAAYFAERERKKQLIEEKRRAKYGDKYDEMMKKRQA